MPAASSAAASFIMLFSYQSATKGLAKQSGLHPALTQTVWLDLINPTADEDGLVEDTLSISVPTRADMREIEASSRLYSENGAVYMTAPILYKIDAAKPEMTTLTFILAGGRLITVRHADLRAFPLYLNRASKGDVACSNGTEIMIGLIETLVDRLADFIERIQDQVDHLGPMIFDVKDQTRSHSKRLEVALHNIGKEGDCVARTQECLSAFDRMLLFLRSQSKDQLHDAAIQQRVKAVHRDIESLLEHLRFLNGRIAFLLAATLGVVANEQNKIIKLFSVMAVILLPPTLIASIYGMNFKHMPELDWPFAYPAALGLMVLSGLIPYLYFRRKGWL